MIIWRMVYGKYFSMDGHGWLVCNCLSSGAIPFGSGSEFRIMISYSCFATGMVTPELTFGPK